MHGDYSRGHEPDRKRGRSYRRVLLQQGRPLLDSDVAASVDALLGEVRATARGLGCAAGSPDLGFLVTPGRLLALFAEAVDDLTVTAGTPDAWIDYRQRQLQRYPALQIVAAGGALARVTLPLLQPRDTNVNRVALWARVAAPTTIRVAGVNVPLAPASPDAPARAEVAVGNATLDPLEIEVPAGGEVWLFALEDDEAASRPPAFWVAPGTYHVDGLVADARGGGAFPQVAFPPAAGFEWDGSPPSASPLGGLLAPAGLAPGGRFVAYFEAWERHITHVEDPGIREEALGATDTTARAQLVAQVKVATITGVAPATVEDAAASLRAAFDDVVASSGQLTVSVPETTPTTDPCALPDPAGYSGVDNRLYRVEVHRGGGLSDVQLKWSRDNGSELFAARVDPLTTELVFEAATALAGGDIVEVLSSVVDLGDDALAQVSAGGFQPARRAVGQLAQLVAVERSSDSDEVAFELADPFDPSVPVAIDLDLHGNVTRSILKLRRWHGIVDPARIAAGGGAPAAGPHVLEDGVSVELSAIGAYRPGEYWQYEARVQHPNANGPWRTAPHGPERRFVPLALLEFQGAAEPLLVLAWLDERFSHPCDLDADAIAFEGERVGSTSDTVQEALEELFEKPVPVVDATCGEIIIHPDDDLAALFDTIPDGGSARMCIHPGTWDVTQTVVVRGKGDLIIAGAGTATLLRAVGIDTVLYFRECGRVHLHDLAIEGGAAGLVGDGLAGSLTAIDCAGLDLERVTVSCAHAASRRMSAVEVRSDDGSPAGAPQVRIHDCHITAGNAQVGVLAVNAASVDIAGNVIGSPVLEQSLQRAVADPEAHGRAARLLVDDILFGETDEFPNDFLLGGDNVAEAEPRADGRRRILAFLREWGNQFIAFTTAPQLDFDVWRQVLTDNRMQGDWRPPQRAPDAFILANLRRLRTALVDAMVNPVAATVTLGAAASNRLEFIALDIARRNAFTAGGQGIVVAGRGTPPDADLPGPIALLGDPRPDVRVIGNRVLGFVQGVHVATSHLKLGPQHAYRVTIADNTIHLSLRSLDGERHGICVGSVFHARITGNTVDLRQPRAGNWQLAPPTDAISARGVFGPLLQIHENSCIGTRNGVVGFALNPQFANAPTWRWAISANAHVTQPPGAGVAESFNW